ncbi:MAG: zinc ribbon domain-containing protein [Thermoplasmata archaeon]|jgi:uncharacterized membrane protein|nr:zinc ribbon domain-containing protein [Thermoplasmata archaeon]
MKCPECGLDLSDFYKFCSRCGAILASPIDVNDSSFDEPKRRILAAISQRNMTDKVISPWWVLLLVITMFVVYAVYFAILLSRIFSSDPTDPDEILDFWEGSFVVLMVGSAVIQAGFCALAYLMIKRLNQHFGRERALRMAVLDLVRVASIPTRKADIVAPEVYQMESVSNYMEKERDPLIWTIGIGLSIVTSVISAVAFLLAREDMASGLGMPGLGLSLGISLPLSLISLICTFYVLYFLSKDMYEHDGRWYNYSHTARIALSKLGFPKGGSFRVSRLPERSMVLYIVLSLFIGIFIYYWWYADLKDPNEHFKSQWEFEDHLQRTLNLR